MHIYGYDWSEGDQSDERYFEVSTDRMPHTKNVNLRLKGRDGTKLSLWLTAEQWETLSAI
jgi:hypothetical protein